MYEWAYALGRGLPILLLMRDDIDKLHARLLTMQYIDFRNRTNPPYNTLYQAIDKFRAEHDARKRLQERQIDQKDVKIALVELLSAQQIEDDILSTFVDFGVISFDDRLEILGQA